MNGLYVYFLFGGFVFLFVYLLKSLLSIKMFRRISILCLIWSILIIPYSMVFIGGWEGLSVGFLAFSTFFSVSLACICPPFIIRQKK
ncbi:YesK family protein [Bacillus amyloliquefaciens]|uniref:YesK family protein n=1 Tax=Bacillus amyloliquefaciens TaxID=1390 RepID=UPI003D7FF769